MEFTTLYTKKKDKRPPDNGVCPCYCNAHKDKTFKTNPSVCQLVGHLNRYSRWCNFTNHQTISINTDNILSGLTMKNPICVRTRLMASKYYTICVRIGVGFSAPLVSFFLFVFFAKYRFRNQGVDIAESHTTSR